MKAFLAIFTLMCVSYSAFADQAVLLSTLTAGGMPGPNGPSSHKVSIMADGSVMAVSTKGRVAPLTVKVAQLSSAALSNLESQIAKLDPKLKLPELAANSPRCMDAPFTDVTATQGSAEIKIWSRVDCNTLAPEDGSGQQLVRIIQGLDALTY